MKAIKIVFNVSLLFFISIPATVSVRLEKSFKVLDVNFRFQQGFLKFDNVSTRSDFSLMNATFWVNTPPNDNSVSLNFDVIFLQETIREQLRIRITNAASDTDSTYSQEFLSTTVDTCKMMNGTLGSLFGKIVMENFWQGTTVDHKCPFAKDHYLKMRNWIVSDTFFPPFIGTARRFKVEINSFGMTKRKKGWQRLYLLEICGRYRR